MAQSEDIGSHVVPMPWTVQSAMEKLGEESQALGQAIYEATQAEQAAGGPAGGEPTGNSASNDDVVDAEVVEDDNPNGGERK